MNAALAASGFEDDNDVDAPRCDVTIAVAVVSTPLNLASTCCGR